MHSYLQQVVYSVMYLNTQVDKTKHFRRDGADIHSDVSISLAQAIFGGTIRVRGLHEEIIHTVCTSFYHQRA